MNKEALAKLDSEALINEVKKVKKELLDLRLSASTMPIKNHAEFKKLRTNIACALTLLKQKQTEL